MLFNFMTPIIRKIEIDSQQRRILSKRYCRKGKLDSLTLQNIFLRLEKSDLLVKPSKEKVSCVFVPREELADKIALAPFFIALMILTSSSSERAQAHSPSVKRAKFVPSTFNVTFEPSAKGYPPVNVNWPLTLLAGRKFTNRRISPLFTLTMRPSLVLIVSLGLDTLQHSFGSVSYTHLRAHETS